MYNIEGKICHLSIFYSIVPKRKPKSHELRICHTSSEDIADGDVPGIVMVVFSCLHRLSPSLKKGRKVQENSLNTPAILDLSRL